MPVYIFEVPEQNDANDLQRRIGEELSANAQIMEKRHLTGEEATWIVVATLAVQALPSLVKIVEALISSKRVKSIAVGDTKIENPSRADVEALLNKGKDEPSAKPRTD